MDLIFLPVTCSLLDQQKNTTVPRNERVSAPSVALLRTAEEARSRFKVQVDILPNDAPSQLAVIAISGPPKQVQAARVWLHDRHLRQELVSIPVSACTVYQEGTFLVKSALKDALFQIMEQTGADVRVRFVNDKIYSPPLVGLDTPSDSCVDIIGTYEQIQRAKLQVMALLGQQLSVDGKLIPLAAGKGRYYFQEIAETTGVQIYLEDTLPEITALSQSSSDSSLVYFAGENQENIERAKKLVEALLAKARSNLRSKTVSIHLKKVQSMLTTKHEKLKEILTASAVHLKLQPFSDDEKSYEAVKVTISAAYDGLIDKTIKALVDLSTECYYLAISLGSPLVSELSRQNVSKPAFIKRFSRMAQKCNSEIDILGSLIFIHGEADCVLEAGKLIKEVEDLQHLIKDIKFIVELSSTYKDFITGKKNGKINKIIKSAGVGIHFVENVPHQLLIEVTSPVFSKAADGFVQLRNELPAEMEFFVADSHHKRIIGVGGKNIQGIMKIYGVYVKFMSADEFSSQGGMLPCDMNVLARTPSKNANNLQNLYHSVMDLIDTTDRSFITQTVEINRKHHLKLLGQGSVKKDTEDATKTKISFPDLSNGYQSISIRGIEQNIQEAVQRLQSAVQITFVILVEKNQPELFKIVETEDYRNLQSSLEPYGANLSSKVEQSEDFARLTLSLKQKQLPNVQQAYEKISAFLMSNNIKLGASQDPPEDWLSLVMSGVTSMTELTSNEVLLTQSMSSYNLPDKNGQNSRFTGSAPNLRSLINEPGASGSAKKMTQAPIGAESTPKLASAPGRPHRVSNEGTYSSAIDQITASMPSTLTFVASTNGAIGGTQPSTSTGSYRRSTFGSNEDKNALFGPRTDTESNNSSSQMSLEGLPAGSPSGSEKSRFLLPLKINTSSSVLDDGPKTAAAVMSGGSDQEFIASVIKNILPVDSNNKLDLLLDSLDLGKYRQTFLNHDVDFEMFLKLKEEDFRELGVSLGARKRLITAMEEIQFRRQQQTGRPAFRSIPGNNIISPNGLPIASAPTSPATWFNPQQAQQEWNVAKSYSSFNNGNQFSKTLKPSSPTGASQGPFSAGVGGVANTLVSPRFGTFQPLSPIKSRPFFPSGMNPEAPEFEGGPAADPSEASQTSTNGSSHPRKNTDPNYF